MHFRKNSKARINNYPTLILIVFKEMKRVFDPDLIGVFYLLVKTHRLVIHIISQ